MESVHVSSKPYGRPILVTVDGVQRDMMNKPEWLQRYEDPNNLTIAERKQWNEEAELRKKQFADAEAFERFIASERAEMTSEDERSRKAQIFQGQVAVIKAQREKEFESMMTSSSIVFVEDVDEQWLDPETDDMGLSTTLEQDGTVPVTVYTPERKRAVENILSNSQKLVKRSLLGLEAQIPAEKLQRATRDIQHSVALAEKKMESWLEGLQTQSQRNIDQLVNIEIAKSDAELMPMRYEALVEESKRDIDAARTNLETVKYTSKIDLDAAKEIYRKNRPKWLRELEQAQVDIAEGGYTERTAWRKRAVNVVVRLQRHLKDNIPDPALVQQLWRDCRDFKKSVNLRNPKEVRNSLAGFTARAIAICTPYDEKYKAVKELLESEIQRTGDALASASNDFKGKSKKFNAERKEILSRLNRARKRLQDSGILEDTQILEPNGWRGVVYRPSLMQYDLMVANRMSREGHDRPKLKTYFMKNLLLCGNAGAWQEAFYIYAAFIGCHLVPDKEVFKYIFLSCKNALPPQGTRAIRMVEEMKRVNVKGDRRLYHIVFCSCSLGGDWRRAAIAFKAMLSDGVKPSAGTYDILIRTIGAHANPEDAPQIYDSLKLAGVPEKIAYTASLKSTGRYGKPSKLKVKQMKRNYF
jgi:hypothetical protein